MKTVQDKNLLEMPIGVFDSGYGGLTILKECGHLYESGQNAGDLYRTVRDWVKENV